MYYSNYYNNAADLKEKNQALYDELIHEFGDDKWTKRPLTVYSSLADFAKYEVEDGWYADIDFPDDYNGAPDLLDYLDYEALGEALKDSWDDSCYYYSDELDLVVYTEL